MVEPGTDQLALTYTGEHIHVEFGQNHVAFSTGDKEGTVKSHLQPPLVVQDFGY